MTDTIPEPMLLLLTDILSHNNNIIIMVYTFVTVCLLRDNKKRSVTLYPEQQPLTLYRTYVIMVTMLFTLAQAITS